LRALVEKGPHHPDIPGFVATLGPPTQEGEDSELDDDAILIEASDEDIEVPPEPDLPVELAIDDLVVGDEYALDAAAESLASEYPVEDQPVGFESGDELVIGPEDDELLVEDGFGRESDALGGEPSEAALAASLAASDDDVLVDEVELVEPEEDEAPETSAPQGFDSYVEPAPEQAPEQSEAAGQFDAQEAGTSDADGYSQPAAVETPPDEVVAESAAAPPGDDGGDEGGDDELDEAAFFLEQGVYEEAREIIETVLLAYPGSARAKQMLAQLDELEAGGGAQSSAESFSDESFDLASELASDELEEQAVSAAVDDYQISVADVLGEFKKGVNKVVKPEDVETHYDLGIAYKEMGLLEDAIGEFEQSASAARGRHKEFEALAMVGLCEAERNHHAEAVGAYERALSLPQTTPDSAKAVQFELALVLEKLGRMEDALEQLHKVHEVDPSFRDVSAVLERISTAAAQYGARKARGSNIGYV